jgi:hypothetical protein
VLIELFRIQRSDQLGAVFATRNPGKIALPASLAIAGFGVYLLGAKTLFA